MTKKKYFMISLDILANNLLIRHIEIMPKKVLIIWVAFLLKYFLSLQKKSKLCNKFSSSWVSFLISNSLLKKNKKIYDSRHNLLSPKSLVQKIEYPKLAYEWISLFKLLFLWLYIFDDLLYSNNGHKLCWQSYIFLFFLCPDFLSCREFEMRNETQLEENLLHNFDFFCKLRKYFNKKATQIIKTFLGIISICLIKRLLAKISSEIMKYFFFVMN
jgi:hypothetical protein